MNSKERIAAVFNKQHTDRIPINHRGFSSHIASHILGREAFVGGGIQQWREAKSLWEGWHEEYLERSFRDAVDLAFATGQDLLRPSYWRAPQKPTKKIDEFTYLYETGEEKHWTVLKHYPESEQTNLSLYHPRQLTLEEIKKNVEYWVKDTTDYKPRKEDFAFQIKAQELYGGEKAVEAVGVGVGIPHDSVWLEAMLLDPGIVRASIEYQAARAEKCVEFLHSYGFKYFLGGMDFASEQGPMFSPKVFRELLLPGLKKVSEACRRFGVYHLFASDGNLWPVAGALFGESGIDGYYEIDLKAGMSLERLRQEYPELTLLGNISSWTLSQGNREEVKEEVLSCLETAKKYGGIIVGLSNYALPETPPENIDIMLELLKTQPLT